jgi:serine/threonine protein kinase
MQPIAHPPGVPSPAAPELLALQRAVEGRYAVEREIGRGGMGVVFLARDVALERQVAIKLLPPAFAAQPVLRERFLREARTAAGLSHPNIVPIHGVEEQGDLVWFVMGYVEGETLARRVQRAGPLPPADVARVMQETAWALSYAHGRGIVHRDIKPDNILIEVGSGRAMVLDFGIARQASGGSLTEVGHVVGTPEYMSPEQAAGESMDGRSDLYSLGVVGYLALTGKAPFEATSASALLSMHLTQPPAPVASVRPGVPRALAEAIDRCLRKPPEERFATGEELANALAGVQSGATEIAPQVRHFMRYAEQYTMMWMVMLIIVAQIWLMLRQTSGPASSIATGMLFGVGVTILDLVLRGRRVLAQGFAYEDVRTGFEVDRKARRR